MKVWECDQWALRHAEGIPFDELDRSQLNKDDAGVINRLGISKGMYREVKENAWPYIGTGWLIADENYKAKIWKYNYDSSD